MAKSREFDFGELEAFLGVPKFPIRIKCALLAWDALEDGLRKHHFNSKHS